MRKIVLLISVILVFSMLCTACPDRKRYPSGRDTQESYGDGTFQVVGRTPAGFYFAGSGGPVIPRLWRVYKVKNKVYLLGQDYVDNLPHKDNYRVIFYGIVEESTNSLQVFYNQNKGRIFIADRFLQSSQITYLSSFSDFSENDKLIFKDMANGNIGYNPSSAGDCDSCNAWDFRVDPDEEP